MAAVISFATWGVAMARPKVKRLLTKVSDALTAYADSRVHNAVPDWQLRRVRQDMKRFDRQMHAPLARRRDRSPHAARHSNAH
jgi:hypothetical protein